MAHIGHRASPSDHEALARCLDVVRRVPAGIICDIDGTISEIAATPADARVDPSAVTALDRLGRHLAMVAIVTGRAASVAEAMVGLPTIRYIGNHGMEQRFAGDYTVHPDAEAAVESIGAALRRLADAARHYGCDDGLLIEDKRLSGSIHYRLASDTERAQRCLHPIVHDVAVEFGLTVTSGRHIFELRPRAAINKGTAITDLVVAQALEGVIFLGDDLTDVDGFKALSALRQEQNIAALRVGVLSPETHAAVLANADVTVSGVIGCSTLLTSIADALDPALLV